LSNRFGRDQERNKREYGSFEFQSVLHDSRLLAVSVLQLVDEEAGANFGGVGPLFRMKIVAFGLVTDSWFAWAMGDYLAVPMQ
jgi:hypothetical protein